MNVRGAPAPRYGVASGPSHTMSVTIAELNVVGATACFDPSFCSKVRCCCVSCKCFHVVIPSGAAVLMSHMIFSPSHQTSTQEITGNPNVYVNFSLSFSPLVCRYDLFYVGWLASLVACARLRSPG